MKLSFLLTTASILFTTSVFAQPAMQKVTVFKNVRIIDGTGAVYQHSNLVIKGAEVVGITKNLKSFPNGDIIDATGKTIMPALIDTHIHLGMLKGTSAEFKNINIANVKRQLQRYAQYGVGAVLSLGRDKDLIYQLRAERNEGKLIGPYIFTAGRGFGVPNGAPPGQDIVYRPTSIAQIKIAMKELASHHPDMVKIWLDDWRGKMPKMKPQIYRAVIQEAHHYGLPVAAHVYYLADAKAVVRAGADVLEHSIRDLPVDAELMQMMRNQHVALVPTLTLTEAFFIYSDRPKWLFKSFFKNALEQGVFATLINKTYGEDPSQRKILKLALYNVKKLYDNGILIAFGTDSGALPTRVQGFAEHRELELLVAAGFTPMQAILIATRDSAKLLNVSNYLGTLEPGKKANFIVLDANPLQSIRNTQTIASVWLDGKKIPRNNEGN